jgi:hypothetical protein
MDNSSKDYLMNIGVIIKAFFRTLFIVLAWLSLLSVPFAAVSYLCEGGLCAHGAMSKAPFFGYYVFCYPLLTLFCLHQCRKRLEFKEHEQVSATILIFPFIYFVVFLWQLI